MRRVLGVLVLALIVVAIAVVVLDRSTTGSVGLTGTTWHWIGTSGAGDVAPTIVPDPARYTVEFGRGRTYVAVADCATVSGPFRIVPAGRTGPLNGLLITPASDGVTGCGPGSLSEAFIKSLDRAITYRIAAGVLTVSLADGRTMTFR